MKGQDMRGGRWGWEVGLFITITFGIAWGLMAGLVAFPRWFESVFGPVSGSNPLFYLAVWSPTIAAVTLTIVRGGWPALKNLLSRLVRWRVSPWVWVAALGFYPALMLAVQIAGLASGQPLAGIDVWWYGVAGGVVSLPVLALGPLGEELGWRGYLLPRMLERMSPIVAALVVGAIWMLWHVPAFFVSGLPQDGMVLPMFVVGGLALSVYVTWLFVNGRQSVLIAGIIPHAIVNAYGEATGAMTWLQVAVMVAGAVLLVVFLGPHLGGRRDASSHAEVPAAAPTN
jgi:membrane protease YdiL (CAAX protease family)